MTKLDDAIAANRDELERMAQAAQALNDAAMANVETLMGEFAASYARMAQAALKVFAAWAYR